MSPKLESFCSPWIPSKLLVIFLLPFPEISQDPIKQIAFPKHLRVTGPDPKVLAALSHPKHTVLKRRSAQTGTKEEPANAAHPAAPLLQVGRQHSCQLFRPVV